MSESSEVAAALRHPTAVQSGGAITMPGRRWARTALKAALALLLLVVGAGVYIGVGDWNGARGWLGQRVSNAIGRPFEIRGDLRVRWQWPHALETGWQRWLPTPIVHAGDVLIGNPPSFAARGPYLAQIEQVAADIALWPMLSRTIDVRSVVLSGPDVRLERNETDQNNWTIHRTTQNEQSPRWAVNLGRLMVNKGQLAYDDAPRQLSVAGSVADLEPNATESGRYGIGFEFSGWHGKANVRGVGKAGHLLSLRDEQLEFPLKLDARAGSLVTTAEGVIANPRQLSGVDFQVSLKGSSMADLFPLTGLVLPNTPAFQTQGHLVGTLKPEGAVWRYSDFTGQFGQSDVRGDVTYTSAKPRPQLKGKLSSKLLRLADLGPVIGTEARDAGRNATAPRKAAARSGKVLPNDPFATDRWDKMDLDLEYVGERIVRPKAVPIDSLRMRAVLDNAQLRLAPLDFGVAQGRFKAQVLMNARTKPLQASLRGDVQGLKLSALFPEIELMRKSLGRVDGGVALDARGQSIAQLLGSANGQAKLMVREGVMSQRLLDMAGLNLGSVLVSKLFGTDKEVRLRCAIADIPVRQGVAQAQNVKLNTDEALIEVTGSADMAREVFDIDVNPKAYELKLFSLRTPLEVRGPFAQPHVGVKPGPLIVRAAAAIAAAAAAPAALALVPITVPGAADEPGCAPLMGRTAASGPERAATPAATTPAPGSRGPTMPAAGEFSGGDRRP